MNPNLRKQIGSFIPILKRNFTSERNFRRYYIFRQNYAESLPAYSKPKMNFTVNKLRCVSSSSLAKSNDSNQNANSVKKEKNINVLDDEEFRNVLSDFAKDFGVGSESEEILEEIKKSIDEQSSDATSTLGNERKPDTVTQVENNYSLTGKEKKFVEFIETDSVIIPSYEEYQNEADNEDFVFHVDQPTSSEFLPEQMKRGVSGVYDVAELVDLLRKENLSDIAVISVPKELHYTDYLVISTAMSPRHSTAVCERVVKLYKAKKHAKDPFVIVEGEKVSEWKALDMGNIVLHVFLEEARFLYDIESLWLFDSAFDRGGNMKDDPLYDAIEAQMAFFNAINDPKPGEPTPKKT